MTQITDLFSHRPYWAKRVTPAPVLPMSRAEMDALGWDACDVILVTGDAYVDHPSFGMALIGRLLEAHGFRVGIIAQPKWDNPDAFRILGKPTLFFGVTAGNMDSMINRYTADRRKRSDDAYSPDGVGGLRPDRSVVIYTQRVKEAFKGVPVVIGGIEASLRRQAHYDYWSDKLRRSILLDTKADLLLYGNAERAIVEVAHRAAAGEKISDIHDLRGTAYLTNKVPEEWVEIDHSKIEEESFRVKGDKLVVRLPGFEQLKDDKLLYAHAARVFHHETNPGNARPLIQNYGSRELWVNPPPVPLSTQELDRVYDQPFTRKPHPSYGSANIPAYEMIRFSINIMRGCFGGCTFCSITEHEGRIIQSRSEESVLKEIEAIRDHTPGFTGNISDLGGPTANMYRLHCRDPKIESNCRRLSCVHPGICENMTTDHRPLIELYRKARKVKGVKRVHIASGLRYDLAARSPEYVKELVTHHVGGYLKIAPEHTEPEVLDLMMKPEIDTYDHFKRMFEKYSKEAGKEQYLIPYFISAHPGTRNEDMINLALWLKKNKFRLDQVQNFIPSPMAIASSMYHSGFNPLKRITRDSKEIVIPKGDKRRRIHKAFLRYHDSKNWPLLRSALREMGREDLIGRGKQCLVPAEHFSERSNERKHFSGGEGTPVKSTSSNRKGSTKPGAKPKSKFKGRRKGKPREG
ncbi:MAG: YgiQ family radical SAM protein, partial [Chromatiales bacterium]|nr:YgiQ family radical SAM protein [Chromatiales bacterium]